MNVKKVAGFLLLRPVFTSRNLTSIALVLFFMGIYVLCGGRISAIPKPDLEHSSFGGISNEDPQSAEELPHTASENGRALFEGAPSAKPSSEKVERALTPPTTPSKQLKEEQFEEDTTGDLSEIKKRLQQLGAEK